MGCRDEAMVGMKARCATNRVQKRAWNPRLLIGARVEVCNVRDECARTCPRSGRSDLFRQSGTQRRVPHLMRGMAGQENPAPNTAPPT